MVTGVLQGQCVDTEFFVYSSQAFLLEELHVKVTYLTFWNFPMLRVNNLTSYQHWDNSGNALPLLFRYLKSFSFDY